MKTKQVKNIIASILYLIGLIGLYMQGTCGVDTALFIVGIVVLFIVQGLYIKKNYLK